jgi:hypothetical protein
MLTEPIVEGAYYEQHGTKRILGPAVPAYNALAPHFVLNGRGFRPNGEPLTWGEPGRLTRRVYITPTDPAEVVAELRRRQDAEYQLGQTLSPGNSDYHGGIARGHMEAADLVAEKLEVAE